jgi:putative ABC transport system permease protein
MMIFRRILLKLRRRSRLEKEMEAELAFHRDLARKHSNPIGLGNITRIQEEARDLWRFSLVEDFWRDIGYALRSLGRTPGFAAVAILTLTLGIGANTAIFTLLHRVMLASLPVEDPQQLIEILGSRPPGPPGTAFSYQGLQNLRSQTQVCSSIIGFSNIIFHTLIDGNVMERLPGLLVTGDYFSTLGLHTVLGRPIMPEDDRPDAGNAVAVISYAMWQNRFGGDPGAIGKTVVLENVPFTIIGVAPAGFNGLEIGRETDIWVPLESERSMRSPSYTSSVGYKWIRMVGRLRPGATVQQARAELDVLYSKSVIENEIAALQREDPRFDPESVKRMRTWTVVVQPAGTGLSRTREQYAKPLLVLMTIVGFLLLIACTNVANLLFARALGREKEIALRLSLGAKRSRLIRQLLTESAVLVSAGGALGLAAAFLLTKYLTAFLASSNALVLDVAPNAATLSFTGAVAVGAVVLFGLAPALRSTDMDFAAKLKAGAQSLSGIKGHRWSAGLIVVQVALLLVLTLGAGLFLRTLHNLNSVDLGFDRSNVLLVTIDPFGTSHSDEQLMRLSMQLPEKIGALPGVKAVSVTRFEPITGGSGVNLSFAIPREGTDPTLARNTWVNYVGPGYFATLGVPVIAGREFNRQDSNSTARVAIVNQAFAQRYFGNASPVGKTMRARDRQIEIIGLVANAKYSEIRGEMEQTVYYDMFQQFAMPLQLLIRTERQPETVLPSVRSEVRSVIGNVSLRERTLIDHIDASIVRERLVTSLAALFGGLGLLLAVIGLYGVVSNSVARRTKEIGIRIALGFDRRRAISMVLREVFVLVGGGIVLGLPLAILITRYIASLLYGLAPDDPLTVIGSVAALLLSAFVAGFIPARRAARVDPMVALRHE